MRAILLTICLAAATEPALADPASGPGQAPVLVAARPIARGTTLSVSDVLLVRRGSAPVDALRDPADAEGRVAMRAFGFGVPLRAGGLARPVLARRGEPVTIRAREAGVVVEMAGVARLDGREGAAAEALVPTSGRRVRGQVASDGALEVRD